MLISSNDFADWLPVCLLGLLLWILGRWGIRGGPVGGGRILVHIPIWLAVCTARRPGSATPVRALAWQMLGILLVLAQTLIVLLQPVHSRRILYLALAFVIAPAIDGLIVAALIFSERRRSL